MWVPWGPGEHVGEVVGEKPDGSRESGRRETHLRDYKEDQRNGEVTKEM